MMISGRPSWRRGDHSSKARNLKLGEEVSRIYPLGRAYRFGKRRGELLMGRKKGRKKGRKGGGADLLPELKRSVVEVRVGEEIA